MILRAFPQDPPALTLYVDPSGQDTSVGLSSSSPLRTLHTARDRIRTFRTSQNRPHGPIHVMISGKHVITHDSLIFEEQDGGDDINPVVIYQGNENAVLTGAISLPMDK